VVSAAIRVACPHCLTSLKLKSREMLGRRVTCPKCREVFSAAEEDEELFESAERTPEQPLAPMISRASEQPLAPMIAWTSRRRSRRLQQRSGVGWFVAGSVLTAIVACAFFVPWRSLVPDINLNPWADTPDAILTQETRLLNEFGDLAEEARAGGSFAELAAKAKNLDGRIVDLYLRAVRVRPVSRERLEADLEKHETELKDLQSRSVAFQERNADPQAKRLAGSPAEQQALEDLKSTFIVILSHVKELGGAFTSMMTKPPEPPSKSQKTEVEILDIYREVAVLISRVDSNSAAQAALPVLRQLREKLETLKKRRPEEINDNTVETLKGILDYERLVGTACREVAQVADVVIQRHNLGSDFEGAVSQIDSSMHNKLRRLEASRPKELPLLVGVSPLIAADSPAASSTPAPLLRRPAGSADAAPAPARELSAEAQAAADGLGPIDPPFAPPNTGPGSFVSMYVHKFGWDHVTFIGFPDNGLSRPEMIRLLTQIQAALAGIPSRWTINQGAILAIASSDTVEQIAAKFHVGRIRKIDSANRRVIIDLPAAGASILRPVPGDIHLPGPIGGAHSGPRRRLPGRQIVPRIPIPAPAAPQAEPAKPTSGL
jgi:hypothetical protein